MARWQWIVVGATIATWLICKVLRPKPETVSATVWRPSAPGFVWPEDEAGKLRDRLAARDDFGIALAGGGERGLSLSHGAVRTLRKAGLLKRAKYMTTTSGSVWFSVPLYYQTLDSLDDYLGENFSPEKLTPELLTGSSAGTGITRLAGFPNFPPKSKAAQASPSHNISNLKDRKVFLQQPQPVDESSLRIESARQCIQMHGPCTCFLNKLVPDSSLQEFYQFATGHFFLHPFGLAKRGSFQCHETEADSLRAQLGEKATIFPSQDMSRDLPFPIFQTALLAPWTGHGNSSIVSFPIEHTPLYTGTPTAYAGENAAPYPAIGDALVSSYAWPGEPLDAVGPVAKSSIRVRHSPTLANTGELAEVQGIATAYISDFQGREWGRQLPPCVVAMMEKILPHANIWSPLHADRHGVPTPQYLAVGDAGIHDDVGHIPLLRRGVKKMVIYTSAAVHDNQTGHDAPNLCEMTYEIAAFGQAGCLNPPNLPGASQLGMPAGTMTVFDPKDFAPFWAEVQRKFAAGEPCVYRGKFTVVDNQFLGIKGGWQVEIVWVIMLPSKTWRSQLPTETVATLSTNFPNYIASEPKYRIVFSAMSQYASWLTETAVVKEVEAMLAEGEREPEHVAVEAVV